LLFVCAPVERKEMGFVEMPPQPGRVEISMAFQIGIDK